MSAPFKVAALFVETKGCYAGHERIEAWDAVRDARGYAGPWPVVAHPPCERWGRYWGGSPTQKVRKIKGDDGGCFAAALAAVRKYGGILEHPEASHAWTAYGLNKPPRAGHWVVADWEGGWTCCVAQGHYGHPAQKLTWLYAKGVVLPDLRWGPCPNKEWLSMPSKTRAEKQTRARAVKTGIRQRMSRRQRAATPVEFRNLLLSVAASAMWATA